MKFSYTILSADNSNQVKGKILDTTKNEIIDLARTIVETLEEGSEVIVYHHQPKNTKIKKRITRLIA